MSQLGDFKSFKVLEIERVLNSLANEDAIRIFISAKEGIKKSTQAIRELDLTQRRYYARLNELVKAGLIERREDAYQLTTLGTVLYNLGTVFNETLTHRDRLDLVDRLKRAKSISLEEIKQILQTISSKGFIGYLGIADLIQPVKMIGTYEDIVLELVGRINEAEKNIRLATYYIDSRAVEAILEAYERGVDLSILTSDRESVVKKLQILQMILSPKIIKLYNMFSGERMRARLSEFPYSFCLIDDKYVIIELPNPGTNGFYMGFSIQNEALCQRLAKTFEDLYEKGKENPIIEQLRKVT